MLAEAAHKADEAADRLDHEELELALRADVERVREGPRRLRPDLAQNGTQGIAVYACGPADLLEGHPRLPVRSSRA